jgi:hypothetical protein
LHIAAANYGFPTMMTGVAPAAGFAGKAFEHSTTDKAKIIEQLKRSFAYALAAVDRMSNADLQNRKQSWERTATMATRST